MVDEKISNLILAWNHLNEHKEENEQQSTNEKCISHTYKLKLSH